MAPVPVRRSCSSALVLRACRGCQCNRHKPGEMQALLAVLCVGAAVQQAWGLKSFRVKRPMKPMNFSSEAERKRFDEAIIPNIDGEPTGREEPSPNAGRVLNKIRAHIIGGSKASKGMFPWQVAIETPESSAFCGGSLISPGVVITAGHCVKGIKEFKVTLGLQRLSGGRKDGRVVLKSRKKVLHKNFDPEMLNNDIAIIKLPKKVKLGKFINTVRLPTITEANSNTYLGEGATASGWGFTSDAGDVSDELNYLTNRTIVPNSKCTQHYGPISGQQLCVDGSNKKAICSGDSGGPLTLKTSDGASVLIGLVSFSHPDTCVGYPQVFTRVASYLKWISQNSGIKIHE